MGEGGIGTGVLPYKVGDNDDIGTIGIVVYSIKAKLGTSDLEDNIVVKTLACRECDSVSLELEI